MGRPKKVPAYVIFFASELASVGADRIYNPDSDDDPENPLFDELQCPPADEVLIALRKSFSLTYPRNPFMDGLQLALSEIRRIGTDALKGLPEVVEALGLKPLPTIIDDPISRKVYLFKFGFAKEDDLNIKVTYEGRSRRLLDLIQYEQANSLVTTLRQVVSDTFSEAHNEDQHEEILQLIRQRIWDVLPRYNACLESIEIEPIAAKSLKDGTDVSN